MIKPDFLIEDFLTSLHENGESDNTIRAYRADIKQFMESDVMIMFCFKPNSTESSMLEAQGQRDGLETAARIWLTSERTRWKPKTTRRKISSLRSWARYMGWRDFLSDYRAPKPARSVPHPIPEGPNGVLEMIEVAESAQLKAMVALCGLAGLRIHEAIKATPGDFDLERRLMTICGKGDKTRIIPVSSLAWSHIEPAWILATQSEDRRLVRYKDRAARGHMTRLAEKAELTRRVASHDLRATFGTAAYKKTKDLRAVQELMGHASSQTTEVYVQAEVDAMRAAVDFA